jgi:hypothetical protein
MFYNYRACAIEPYNDEYMVFDSFSEQYKLTESAILRMGIDLRARLAERKAPNPEMIIEHFLNDVSTIIYAYIHDYSVNNQEQDWLIAHMPSARPIIFRALKEQAPYLLKVGNLMYSIKPEEKAAAVIDSAKTILSTPLKETGKALTYMGVL